MKQVLALLFLKVLLLMLPAAAPAQESIPLSSEDITRLGIVFAPVEESARGSGAVFPATVVTSPEAIAAVSALYGGVLERWLVLPGEAVEAGAELAHIRSAEVLDLQSEWQTARTRVEETRFELEKDTGLLDQGVISGQRLNQTRREHSRALIELENTEAKLRRAGIDAGAGGDQPDPGLYVLRAPSAGVLTHRVVAAGTPVQPGMHLASLDGAGRPWLSALIPARLAQPLRNGQALTLEGSNAGLVLRQKDFEVDPATQTVEILAEFTSAVGFLPGQILRLRLPPPGEGVLVPGSAVVHSGDDTAVYVRTPAGVEVRVLELVPAGEAYLAGAGLRPGEEVVVRGAALLKGIQLGLGGE